MAYISVFPNLLELWFTGSNLETLWSGWLQLVEISCLTSDRIKKAKVKRTKKGCCGRLLEHVE